MIKIDNWVIEASIEDILNQVRLETNSCYLKKMKATNNAIMITCPFHGNHDEIHPSCGVDTNEDSPTYSVYHCFACGAKGPLYRLIGRCFEEDDEFGKDWLIKKFGGVYVENPELIDIKFDPQISDNVVLEKLNSKPTYLDESILDTMSNYHPYMVKRKLTEKVVDKFKIKYDNKSDCIVFPVWDELGHLVSLTRRSVGKKRFNLESSKNKPVYLLNFILKEHISSRVMVVESQFNALTGWVYGVPSVALFGTGSFKQYEILEKSGVRNFLLAFDGDEAGRKGRDRFINYFRNKQGISISYLTLPEGKDVNDLSREEFLALPETFVK